jgi:hypothetical protein
MRTHRKRQADRTGLARQERSRLTDFPSTARSCCVSRRETADLTDEAARSLASGEAIRLAITNRRGLHENARVLSVRIHGAWSAHRPSGMESAAALLGREGRGMSAWITNLRALGAGANADMRTAPIPRERLLRVVEDASLDPTSRAAAAVALGLDLDEEGRARLRAAAESTAAPKLRFAIEKVASLEGSEDAAIEAALAELEAEEVKSRTAEGARPRGARNRLGGPLT